MLIRQSAGRTIPVTVILTEVRICPLVLKQILNQVQNDL
jgi:hypothetical protein